MKISSLSRGFSLVEVTLALGIAAFTMVAMFGLIPLGVSATHNSSEVTIASTAASVIIADLRNAPRGATTTPTYNIPIADGEKRIDEGGNPMTTAVGGRYRAIINIDPPAAGKRTASFGTITIYWPAEAKPENALGRFQTFFALDRN